MTNKVFCKDCKWFSDGECRVALDCPIFVETTPDYVNGGRKFKRHKNLDLYSKYFRLNSFAKCCSANENGECPFYRRKWWKFWAPLESKMQLDVILRGGVK